MAKQLLNIDKFPTGIINNETSQTVDGFVDMVWIDMISQPWVAQINNRLENDTTTWMTTRPLSAAVFDGKVLVWNEDEEIWYENTANTWTLLHTNTNNWDIEDLIVYQKHLIYASIDELWRSTNTTIAGWFTDNPTWGSGTNAFDVWESDKPHFFKIFNNRLYISDGNLLAELDWASSPSDPTLWVFTSDKFMLPEGEIIISMEVIGSLLALWTESGNYYEWDWVSANASTIVKSNIWGINALIQIENTLFALAWIDWVVYRFNGADFKPDIKIPNNRFNLSSTSKTRKPAVRRYKNWFMFAIPKNGIYIYDRVDTNSKFILTKYGNLSDWQLIDQFDWDIRMLFITDPTSSIDSFIVWYEYNGTTTIDRTSSSTKYRMYESWAWDDTSAPFFETQVYELRDNNWKPNKVQWVQWLFNDTNEISEFWNIRIYYRINRNETYVLLWDIWNDWVDFDKILRGIWKRVDKVQFKILFWAETISDTNPRNTKLTWLRIF